MADFATVKKKYLPAKLQQKLKGKELAIVDKNGYKTRMEIQLSRHRNVKSFTDVVQLLEDTINGLISDALDIKKANSLGYLGAVSLTAIKMQKQEKTPSERLADRLKSEDASLDLTEKEIKSLAYATNANIQINIFNKASERPSMDESKAMTIDAFPGQGELSKQALSSDIVGSNSILRATLISAHNARKEELYEPEPDEMFDFKPPTEEKNDRTIQNRCLSLQGGQRK